MIGLEENQTYKDLGEICVAGFAHIPGKGIVALGGDRGWKIISLPDVKKKWNLSAGLQGNLFL